MNYLYAVVDQDDGAMHINVPVFGEPRTLVSIFTEEADALDVAYRAGRLTGVPLRVMRIDSDIDVQEHGYGNVHV